MTDNPYQLQTLSRALDVLDLLETAPGGLTLTAIAARMGEANPVIFRVLKTLESKGFIQRVGDTKRYAPAPSRDRLGLARLLIAMLCDMSRRPPQPAAEIALRLEADRVDVEAILNMLQERQLAVASDKGGWSLSPHLPDFATSQSTAELVAALRPVMERLHEETGETIAIFVRNGAMQVALQVMTSRQPLRYSLETGSAYPVNRGAAGKACLAWLEESEIREILADPALSSEDIDVDALLAELHATRQRGYACSLGERIEGVAAVAMPVTDMHGRIRCVVAVSGPQSRFTEQARTEYGTALRAALRQACLFRDPGTLAPAPQQG